MCFVIGFSSLGGIVPERPGKPENLVMNHQYQCTFGHGYPHESGQIWQIIPILPTISDPPYIISSFCYLPSGSQMTTENPSFIHDFRIKILTYRGCSIGMFDYRIVPSSDSAQLRKITMFIGKSTINAPFSIAMLVYHKVNHKTLGGPFHGFIPKPRLLGFGPAALQQTHRQRG